MISNKKPTARRRDQKTIQTSRQAAIILKTTMKSLMNKSWKWSFRPSNRMKKRRKW